MSSNSMMKKMYMMGRVRDGEEGVVGGGRRGVGTHVRAVPGKVTSTSSPGRLCCPY